MNGNFGVVRAIFFGCSVAGLWGCAPIRPVAFEPFADGNFSVTMSPMSYSVGSTGKTILVPAGFVTDFASTPRAMWSFLPPFGTYQKAAVMHDYLYWTQGCTRKQADDILWEAMVESGISETDLRIIYAGVRAGGQSAWDQNSRDRQAGGIKFVLPGSAGKIQLDANDLWPEYQATHPHTAYDVKPVPPPAYCTAVSSDLR